MRQRRRLASALGEFDAEAWAYPSRCEGWSNRDVIIHLESTNSFWSFSIAQGLRGEPTEFLATFDPVASPADLVAGSQDASSAELLDRFVASTEALAVQLTALADDDWSTIAEAPPGHLSVSAVAHHALWDSWVHERDVLAPLGITAEEEPDEVSACLRYAAALAPALGLTTGVGEPGVLAVSASDPDLAFVVETTDRVLVRAGTTDAADRELRGPAADLVETLSLRRPVDPSVSEAVAWLVGGLARQFDAEQG